MLSICFFLYFGQGLLYAQGTFISQTALTLIFIISLYYFIKLLMGNTMKGPFFRAWSILLALNIAGFVVTADFDPQRISMFKNILTCMLSFYPFYYYAENDLLESKHLLWFFAFMLLITIMQFYHTKNLLMSLYEREEVVNNISYMFVALAPFLFLLKKNKLISGVLMGVILFYVILGNKRGALVAAAIVAIIYAFYQLRTIEKHERFRGYVIAFIMIIAIGYFAYSNYISNEFFINRMSMVTEGLYSGRDYIYADIYNKWLRPDTIPNFFFGYGFAGSLELTGGHYAHNDWLELLSNFGLPGVCVYLYLLGTAIKYIFNKEWASDKRIFMFTIVVMWFIISMFSMWYTKMSASLQAILLAYLIGCKKISIG